MTIDNDIRTEMLVLVLQKRYFSDSPFTGASVDSYDEETENMKFLLSLGDSESKMNEVKQTADHIVLILAHTWDGPGGRWPLKSYTMKICCLEEVIMFLNYLHLQELARHSLRSKFQLHRTSAWHNWPRFCPRGRARSWSKSQPLHLAGRRHPLQLGRQRGFQQWLLPPRK